MLSPSNSSSSPKKKKSKIPCLQDEDKEDVLLHPTKGDIIESLSEEVETKDIEDEDIEESLPQAATQAATDGDIADAHGHTVEPSDLLQSFACTIMSSEEGQPQVSCQDEDIESLSEAATAEFYHKLMADVHGHPLEPSDFLKLSDSLKEKERIEQAAGKNRNVFDNLIKDIGIDLPPPPPPFVFRGFVETEEDPENEHFKHYMNLLAESGGYYAPRVPMGVKIAYSRPAPIMPSNFDTLDLRAKNALDWYNNEKKGDEIYEFVKVECASRLVMRGIIYSIAFIARGVDSGREVPFRAKVCFGVGGVITVEYCERVAESSAKFAQLRGKCCSW